MGLITPERAIALTGDLPQYTYAGAWGLLAALAVLAFVFSSLRSLVLGDGRSTVDVLLRIGFVVVVLSLYHLILSALIDASEGLIGFFNDRADWSSYFSSLIAEFRATFEPSDQNVGERLLGLVSGSILTVIFSISYFFVFIVFCVISYLSAMGVALLNVFGPLLIVGGVVTAGKTTGAWLRCLIQVLLWPVIPPFLMLMILDPSVNALEAGDNVAFVIAQNSILGFLALFSPLFVTFVMGRGGATMFGSAMMLLGANLARSAVKGGIAVGKRIAGSGSAAAESSSEEDGAAATEGSDSRGPRPGPVVAGHQLSALENHRRSGRPEDQRPQFVWNPKSMVPGKTPAPQRMGLTNLAKIGGVPADGPRRPKPTSNTPTVNERGRLLAKSPPLPPRDGAAGPKGPFGTKKL